MAKVESRFRQPFAAGGLALGGAAGIDVPAVGAGRTAGDDLLGTVDRGRGDPPTDRLWVTDEGKPFTYYGAQAIFRRIKARSGVRRVHAHLLRHTFAQVALEKGAPRAEVQGMLGHRTDAMTRRYAGTVRQQLAATNMARYGAV